MGAEAALAVLDADEDSPPSVICIDGNQIVKKPLMECVERVSVCIFITDLYEMWIVASQQNLVLLPL